MNNYDTSKLRNVNNILDKKHGVTGTPEREKFRANAIAWHYGEIFKEKREEMHLTQEELAERIGRKRSYIARIEKGKTDIQISSLIRIAEALGLKFTLA
jgi:ribosome-binding protein aMBF1 (putative translation factor)